MLGLSPLVIAVVTTLIVVAAWKERGFWSRAFGLRGNDVAPPIALMVGFLAVTAGLYLLQGTSPNASSIRYLLPVWVALPGLLACGLGALPRRAGVIAGLLLFVPWGAAQFGVWSDLDRSSPRVRSRPS